MLPNQLVSLYQQYKHDTDSVASWLASTAKSCGYPADLLSTPLPPKAAAEAPQPSKRLKGKDRKLAKLAAEKGKKPPPSTAPKASSYIVALKDFLQLANYIAGRRKPTVPVPDVFSVTINRLIDIRSGFGDLMTEHGVKRDAESDTKHGYFVGILEAVRDALCPSTAGAGGASSTDAKNDAPQNAMKNLGNKFAALSVQEPSPKFLQDFLSASPERPKPQANDPLAYEAEPQTSPEDTIFAFLLLMNDLNRIRSRISWIWSKHCNGLFDLPAAALATDTAISLARGLIDDAAPLLSGAEGGGWWLTNQHYVMACLQKGYKEDQLYLKGQNSFNHEYYDMADKTYLVAHKLMLALLEVIPARGIPLAKEGIFGRYDPNSDWASKTGLQKFVDDKILITEFFTEQMTVMRGVPQFPVEDEFLRGIRDIVNNRKVTYHVVFAAQIFLDIHHIVRGVADAGFNTMVNETSAVSTSIAAHFEYFKGVKMKEWPASNDTVFRQCRTMIEWVGKDPVYQAKAKAYTASGTPVPPEMESHRIWRYSPVLSGLYMFQTRVQARELGITVANGWGSIAFVAHLYNALMNEKLIPGPWPDMEIVLSLLGESSFWVGAERPKTHQDCFQKFCLQIGVSASSFAARRRRKSTIESRAGPRGIKEGAPVSSMFADRAVNGIPADFAWTPEQIDDIVSRSQYDREGSEEDGTMTITPIDDPQELRDRNRTREQLAKARASGKKPASGETRISPEQLVEGLVYALQSETLELAFPYLFFHRWCWRVLRTVKQACDPVLRQLYGPAYIENESELPFVVGYILMLASGLNGPQNMKPMEGAAEAMGAMLNSGTGRAAIKTAALIGIEIDFGSDSESEQADE